jgi:two-component system NarL family response regulator
MPSHRANSSLNNSVWQEDSQIKFTQDMALKANRFNQTLQTQTSPNNGHDPGLISRDYVANQSSETDSISILIADDHPLIREGLSSLINRRSNMHVVAQASDGGEAVELFFSTQPDVALVDLRMPVMDGIQTVLSICERQPCARIAIVTAFQCEEDIYRVLRAGAHGYLIKGATIDEIIQCIEAIHSGQTWIPPRVGAKLAKRVGNRELTVREMEVMGAVASGKSNKEIGVAFDISEATVKVHVTHILEKLNVAGRTEAINVAVTRGLVRMGESVAA